MGSVSIGFYGPFFLNDEDLSFINALNRLLALVALAALAAAICVGILMARGITVPLARSWLPRRASRAGSGTFSLRERRVCASWTGLHPP